MSAALLLLSCVFFLVTSVRAEEQASGAAIGVAADGLPGVIEVGVIRDGPRMIAGAATVGYGVTGEIADEGGAHHRLRGVLALGAQPLPWFLASLRLNGHYDRHPEDELGSDDSFVGDPRLVLRAGQAGKTGVGYGVEVGVWVPGEDAPSLKLAATSFDFKALGSFTDKSKTLTFALNGGFRLDQSDAAAPDLERLRLGDRIALGSSSFNAVLLGAGLSKRLGRTELLGEVRADLLVGSGAPGASVSPLRGAIGVRQFLSRPLSLEANATVSASSAPPLGPAAPLVPIEPRLQLMVGLRYVLGLDRAAKGVTAVSAQKVNAAPEKPVATEQPGLRGKVLDQDGKPVALARVRLTFGETLLEVETLADGSYEFKDVPTEGQAELTVAVVGFKPVKQAIDFKEQRGALQLNVEALPPMGQLRGLVRSFSGAAVRAKITVAPLGEETTTDDAGYFQLDVVPGKYEIIVTAQGYAPQRRTVTVERDGVTVLNADLRKAAP